mmetsp:Transcript_6917/g.17513  ORF Transcript_6917/g.17513 Transcript_6917/m.17513 type:complete len:108 (+) Transcript_6917:2474-2797(+)
MLHEDERKRKAKVKIVLEWLVVERGDAEHLLFATQFRCAQHAAPQHSGDEAARRPTERLKGLNIRVSPFSPSPPLPSPPSLFPPFPPAFPSHTFAHTTHCWHSTSPF